MSSGPTPWPATATQTIQAPNLNRLAEDSFVVERAYCTQPVCTPSRSSIMTGFYPHTTGCIENNDLHDDPNI